MKNPFKSIKPFIVEHEPEILMSSGIAGMIFVTAWSIKATVKAVRLVDKRKCELNTDKLSAKETFKTVWKCYIPPVIGTIVSIPCIVASNRISSRRNAALVAAYTIAETSLQEYKDKTKEIVGPEKEKEIHEAISKDKAITAPAPAENVILSDNGDILFQEPITGRYFKSNWNKILKAANELNAAAISGSDEITLSDWLLALGLSKTSVSDSLGWTVSDGKRGLLDISMDSCLTPDKIPCGVIYYNNDPKLL